MHRPMLPLLPNPAGFSVAALLLGAWVGGGCGAGGAGSTGPSTGAAAGGGASGIQDPDRVAGRGGSASSGGASGTGGAKTAGSGGAAGMSSPGPSSPDEGGSGDGSVGAGPDARAADGSWVADASPPSPPAAGQTACVNADGVDGVDTYALIRGVLGPDAIDDYPDTLHMPPLRHVREDVDALVGPHFVFLSHRDIDLDHLQNDRQRIEITVHAGGPDVLKGHDGLTLTYTWRFKFAANLKVSAAFGHFFQIKSEGGNWSAPIVTLSAHGDVFEIHQTGNDGNNHTLASAAYTPLRDQWLECSARATFSHQGSFFMTVKKLDGTMVLKADMPKADMWRDGDFTKPKWGIYRSLNDRAALNASEDSVRFANIGITSGSTPTSDCHRQ